MTDYSNKSKIIIVLIILGISFFMLEVLFNPLIFTGIVTGLPYEQGFEEDAVCWGNASFDCSECVENCTDFGCSYITSECSGEPNKSCMEYPDDRQCGHAGCDWDEEEEICGGELLCAHFEDVGGCEGVACSWQEENCSGHSNCTQVDSLTFCGLASGCSWMEADCANGDDDDVDGDSDCEDSDCDGYFKFNKFYCEYAVELNCTDGYDNDGDGDSDINDTDCEIPLDHENQEPNNPSLSFVSSSGNNGTTDDLILSITDGGDPDNDSITNITDFRLNGQSIAILNFPFDSNSSDEIIDYSSHSNDLSFVSDNAVWTQGKIGGAYDFDGSDKRINTNIGDITNLGNMTMSFWMYPETWQKGLFSIANSNSYRWYFMVGNPTNGIRILNRYAGGNYDLVADGVIPTLNDWYYVTVTISEQEGTKLYIDGNLVATKDNAIYTFKDIPLAKTAYIGAAYYSGFSDFYDGKLDEFKIYDRIISDEQIQKEYEYGLQGIQSLTIVSEETNIGDSWNVAVTSIDGELESQTVISNEINLAESQLPYYSNFVGETTDFSSVPDLENVDGLVLEKIGFGKISWNNDDLNVSQLDFNEYITITSGSVVVDIPNLNNDINSSANITIYNLSYEHNPLIYRDGIFCDDCSILNYVDNNLKLGITHFTNYSWGENSEMVIYDSNESSFIYNSTSAIFFANYTNKTDGNHISGAVCDINFDDGNSATMNEGINNYNYTKINGFTTEGDHSWNVSCNMDGYELQFLSDSISVQMTPGPPAFTHLWNKTFGGGEDDNAQSIIYLADEGFAVAGSTENYGAGQEDFWILKLNSAGELQWNKTFGGSGNDKAYEIIETNTNDLIVVGETYSYGAGQSDFWILKLNSAGELQWNKTFGGIESESANSLTETSSGDILIAGSTRSYGAGQEDFWILKLNSAGELQWNKTFGTISASERGYSIIETSDGGIAITGTQYFGVPYAWTLKLDSTGNQEWNHTFSDGAVGDSIIETEDNGFIVADAGAPPPNQLYIFKLDSEGVLEWNITYDSTNDRAYSIISLGNGVYTIAGYAGDVDVDFLLLTINSYGQIFWNATIGGSNFDVAHSITSYKYGGFAVAGYTESYGAGDSDMWVVKLEIPSYYSFNYTYTGNQTTNTSIDVIYEFNITNNGYRTDNYTISVNNVNSLSRSILSNNSINMVEPSRNGLFNITVGDYEPGVYEIIINITSVSNSSVYSLIPITTNIIGVDPPNPPPNNPDNDCEEDWNCTNWGNCTNESLKYRNCTDLNECDTIDTIPNIEDVCVFNESMDNYNKKDKKTIYTQCKKIPNGSFFKLGDEDKLKVLMDDNSYKTIQIKSIRTDKSLIQVDDWTRRKWFNVGTIESFDFDNDESDDLNIMLKGIHLNYVDLWVNCILEKEEPLEIKEFQYNLDMHAEQSKNLVGKAIMFFPNFNLLSWWLLIFIIPLSYLFIKFINLMKRKIKEHKLNKINFLIDNCKHLLFLKEYSGAKKSYDQIRLIAIKLDLTKEEYQKLKKMIKNLYNKIKSKSLK